MFHTANAQTKESAPQEPPFVEENEFDLPATPLNSATPAQADPLKSEADDAASIENEILQSGGEPAAPPPANSTVDLNKDVPEAGSKADDLLLEDEAPVIAAPTNEIPSSEIPMEEPPVPVKAAAPVYSDDVVAKSAAGGVRYIHHPQAAVGLIRIEKDGTYVYKTKDKGEVKTSGSFRIGSMDAPKISSEDGTSFAKMYSETVPVLMFDYDWQPFKMSQNFKIQAGVNIMLANGNGRFAESGPNGKPTQGEAAKEEYTFAAIPLNAGFIYRFQYMDRQILAPYVLGGGSYIPVVEYRDDGKSTNLVGTPAAYGGGGLLINVGAIDRDTAFTLRSEYGVTNLWVSLEYRYLNSFSDDVKFESNVISAGLTMDY
jgi:hypothetical protein